MFIVNYHGPTDAAGVEWLVLIIISTHALYNSRYIASFGVYEDYYVREYLQKFSTSEIRYVLSE
jgi:hypothetical protein